LRHGLFLALCAGIIGLGVIFYLSGHLALFHQRPEVAGAVNPFLILIGLSLVPVFAYLALRQFAESMGRPWVPMMMILGGVILNAFLNWVLIYGHLGAPALGLTGSGISTLVSRLLGTAAIFIWLCLDPSMRAAWPTRWLAPVSWERMRRMLAVGMPVSASLLFEGGAFSAATVMMGWLGAAALAAHQIAISCAALTFMVPLGLSMALGIRIGAAVGGGHHARLRAIWAGAVGISIVHSVSFTVVYLVWGRRLASFFVGDGVVISTATVLLVVAAVFQVFDGAQVINSAALRGLTDVRVPAAITFTSYWVVAIPLGYMLGIRGTLGPAGIWIGLAAGLAGASIFLGARFVRLTRPAASA
jgi:MATE family multidrug resistance protein